MRKATRQQTKNHNTSLILRTIYHQGEMSRADIARATHLTRPTVSNIVATLIDDQFVIETRRGPSAGGKPPTLLNIAQDAHHLICLDLGSQEFRGAIVNLRGDILDRLSYPAPLDSSHDALQLVYELIEILSERSTAPVLGIGIGTPGLIDFQQGIVKQAVNLDWIELPLKTALTTRYQTPVYVANDSHMAALAEYTFGTRRNSQNLIVIKIGQGIGAGIVLNGQLYSGDGLGAGEIGHVVVVEDGLACSCGNHGCLETIISTRAILRRAKEIAILQPSSYLADAKRITWETICLALQAGDQATEALVWETGRYLGIAIAYLIAGFNIHQIVISGRVSHFGRLLLNAAKEEAARRVLPSLVANTTLHYTTLGSDIVILGCSAMILKQELEII